MPEMSERLRYGTPAHNKVRDALLDRYNLSYEQMSKFHATWDKQEDTFRLYLPTRREDSKRKSKRDVSGQPQYTDIVVPYSYAILMSAHMYWSGVFLSRDPVLQFQSQSGEKEQTALGVESLLAYQIRAGLAMPPWFVWILDMGKYGLGVIGRYWEKRLSRVVDFVDVPAQTPDGVIDPNRKPKKQKVTREMISYQGNKIFNIRPREWFPDPRVPLIRFQEGEFCGHTTYISGNDIARNEEYFNKDAVKKGTTSAMLIDKGSSSGDAPLRVFRDLKMGKEGATILEMEVDLIPKLWDVGESEKPEKWVFVLANMETILLARPMGELHDKFNYDIQMYEIEGHDYVGRGVLELLQPLNDGMTWLLNSHFYNVRKSLNDNFVYDPMRIVGADLEGGPGRAIRLRPAAYGTSIDSVFKQLPVADITRSHINDLQALADLMQRVSGVMDNTMGMLDPGGGKTATEVRSANSFSANRLKTQAEFNSAIGWTPLAMKMLAATQQYLDQPMQVRIAGQQITKDGFMVVSPEDIAGGYDFVPADGTLPIDRMQMAMMMTELFKVAAQFSGPQGDPIFASYNLPDIWAYGAELTGIKNMDRFRLKPVPDQDVGRAAQAGDLVPSSPGGVPGNGVMRGLP